MYRQPENRISEDTFSELVKEDRIPFAPSPIAKPFVSLVGPVLPHRCTSRPDCGSSKRTGPSFFGGGTYFYRDVPFPYERRGPNMVSPRVGTRRIEREGETLPPV